MKTVNVLKVASVSLIIVSVVLVMAYVMLLLETSTTPELTYLDISEESIIESFDDSIKGLPSKCNSSLFFIPEGFNYTEEEVDDLISFMLSYTEDCLDRNYDLSDEQVMSLITELDFALNESLSGEVIDEVLSESLLMCNSSIISITQDSNYTEQEWLTLIERILSDFAECLNNNYDYLSIEQRMSLIDDLTDALNELISEASSEGEVNIFIITNASEPVKDFPVLLFSNGYNLCDYYYGSEAVSMAGLDFYEENITDAFLKTCDHYTNESFISNSSLLSVKTINYLPTIRSEWFDCENTSPVIKMMDNGKIIYCNDSVSKSYAIVNTSLIRFLYNNCSDYTYYLMLEFLGVEG